MKQGSARPPRLLHKASIALAAWLSIGSMPPGAAAAPFDDAMNAYRQGEYAAAHAQLAPLAEHGDSSAQFYFGMLYQDGKGVAQDPSTAAAWYRKSAAQGHAGAQKTLADLLYLGKGVAQDYAASVALYREAARAGHAEAQFMLGHMLHQGLGVEKDITAAVGWYRTAADQGYQIGDVLIGLE